MALDKHVSAVARSCNYRARPILHIRHFTATDLQQTLACGINHPPKNRLLQYNARREYCRHDCSAGASSLQTATASAPLAAGPTADHIS